MTQAAQAESKVSKLTRTEEVKEVVIEIAIIVVATVVAKKVAKNTFDNVASVLRTTRKFMSGRKNKNTQEL